GDFLIGGLYTVDDKITLITSYGLNSEYSTRPGTSDFFKKVLETKQSLELFNEEDLPVVSTGMIDIKIKYMLFLPIVYNNKSVAVLELGSLAKPREEVRDYLEKIKDQLAIGITNARALLQLEKLVIELKELNEDYQKQNIQIKEQNDTLLQLHNELKIQAKELEKQRQRAFDLTDAKSKFLANMSHELRTPMNSILGLTELMLEKVDLEPRNKERLEVVLNSGKRLMTLINDILDLSKIEAGKVDVQYEDVILEEIISEVSTAISMLANEKNISYEVERKIDPHTVISTDRGKVVQVLINLLGNAVKYTDEGRVVLKISVANETLKFEVVDTGIGISQEEIDVIFEEFRQSNSSKSQRRGGTGLGLTISNKLAEIMGGNLDVKSEINQGSTFIFSVPFNQVKVFKKDDKQEGVDIIPVSKDDNRPLLITDQPSELISSVKFETVDNEPVVIQPVNEVSELEIMIVDDDPNTLFTLAEIVQEANCNPIIVHNGKECLELLETKIPDLILLDIIMPEMDGFKTIQQIKKNNKWSNIPVIAVTAKAMDEDHKIILKHGFTDYIPKPVNPTFVEQKIQQLITQLKTI
ncbi:MAG: ATP-binding protein, partial [Ignavibacteriaceae bacterium]|nr:ATP-binding protein [Ignavibacteriaceae bacterium]